MRIVFERTRTMSDQKNFDVSTYDAWIVEGGPAAVVMTQQLVPVEGRDGVFFPATYAAQQGADKDKEKFQGGYNIDEFPDNTNVCLIDSVGSQANRIEPLFMQGEYANLVPQHYVTFGDKAPKLNLLHANHRAADAIFRCSSFEADLRTAFQQVLKGNYESLARIAPTSLVFGAWDSRATSAKVPRVVASTIRAFNVNVHTRSANFLVQMTIDLAKEGIVPDAGSKEGFSNALATKNPGGVQLRPNGCIRRDVTLNLAAIRRISVTASDGTLDKDKTTALRRYILGLSLIALTAPPETFLRQGCNLVPDFEHPADIKVVDSRGNRTVVTFSDTHPLEFAKAVSKEFNVAEGRQGPFSAELAVKAGEGKPEKLTGEIVSANIEMKTLILLDTKKAEHEISTNDSTTYKRGKDTATFEAVVQPKTKVDVMVLSGVATSITSKSK
jgi:CRISPR-associated protein Csb1